MKHARDIWIFDEPTNDLDLETIGILEEELRNYEGALIIVGHDRSFINNVTDKCWVLHDGKLENFEAGFAQAELFLEAIHLEEELKKKNVSQPQSGQAPIPVQSKLSNKEKNRYDELPAEIEKLEARVTELKAIISEVDYSTMTKEKKVKIEKIQSDLAGAELRLEKTYEEWARLEEKLTSS